MLESDSEAHHEYHQNPSAWRECLPYLHLVIQGGDSVTISVDNPAEHQEESSQDGSCNQKQPPKFIRWLHAVCIDSFGCDDDSRNPPDGCSDCIQMFPVHKSVLHEIVLLPYFIFFHIRKAVEICLPARTEIDVPSPESSYKRSRSGIMLCPHRAC